jgi:hypothetical protein
MSNNRSPSPTPSTSNTSNNRLPLDIRTEQYENAGPPPHPSERRIATPSRRPHSFIQEYITETPGTHHSSRLQENTPDERPGKRMRVQTPEERVDRYRGRSSPSDSSQSDRGDHGSEGEQNQAPASPTTYEFAEPKKKRTRTLTTPHQAAVLHALLAQVCPVAHKHRPVTEVGPPKSRGFRLLPCERKWESRLA